jgi:inner membrane protein
MASAFAHALVAVALGKTYPQKYISPKFWLLGMLCTILPDADVVMFKFGVPYEHMFGHRGFSHSLVFAVILGVIVTALFYRSINTFFKTGTVVHPVLYALHGLPYFVGRLNQWWFRGSSFCSLR